MRSFKTLRFILALLTAAITATATHAATRFWTGNNGNSNWTEAGNWNGTLTAADYAYISSAYYGTNPTPVISTGSITIARLGVGTDGGEGIFTINGNGVFATTNAVYIGRSSGGGTVGLDGFVYVSGSGRWISTGGDFQVGEGVAGSLGVIDVSQSGTITIERALLLGHNVASSSTMTVRDNAFVSVGRNLQLGRLGTATLILSDNAQMTAAADNAYSVFVGDDSSGNGTLIIKDNATFTTADSRIGIVIGNKDGSVGTVKLQGGVVTTGSFAIGLGTGTLELNGGVVRAAAAHNNFFTNLGNLAINGAGVAAGKSAFGFDTNNVNVTITNTLTYTGATNTIAFEKLGSGTLTLSAAATYAGATRITAGTLKLGATNGIAASSAVEIASGATLDANAKNQTLQNLSGAGRISAASSELTLQNSASSLFSGDISGATSVTKTGAGLLVFASNMNYGATTTISSGTLQLGNGSSAGRLTSAIVNNAALVLNHGANNFAYTGTLSGSGTITKVATDTGIFTLSADSSGFTGVTNIDAGSLVLNGASAKLGGTVNLAANTNLTSDGILGTLNTGVGSIITVGGSHGNATIAENLTLTGALSLVNNTTLRYDLFDGSNDLLTVASLTRTGTSTFDLSTAVSGSYKLITATGGALATSSTDNLLTTVNTGALSQRSTVNYSVTGNDLWLTIDTTNIAGNKWSGTNTGSWIENFANWQADDQLFLGGDSIIFDDTAAGTHTVSVDADVRAADMTVDTASNYTFIGSHNITTSTVAPAANGSTGKLTKTGAGTLILANTGSNYFENGIVLTGGTLQGNARTLGNADILNNAALVFDQTAAATYTAAITGIGSITKINTGTLTLNNAANTYTGGISVSDGILELQNSGVTTQGAIAIAAPGTLRIASGASYTIQNALTGNGTFDISLDAPDAAVNFTSAAGNAFAGTVRLGQSTFDLSGQNTAALTAATLNLGAGNTTTIGNGVQNIGGLALTGGKLIFSATIPTDTAAAGIINTGTLALTSGTIQVSLPASVANPNTNANLFVQDEGTAITRLVNSTTVTGNTSGLVLVDQTNTPVSAGSAKTIDITQGGVTVATGTYNYGFSTEGGLGVNYKLTSLNILADQTLDLAPDIGATGAAAVFTTTISGSGNLCIDATNAPVTLSAASKYTGTTTLTHGTLIFASNNALGQTAALDMAADTTVNLNAHSQTIGALTVVASSTFDLAGGSLKLTKTSRIDGVLTGAGAINVSGGTLAINGANTGLTASTTIANNASVALNNSAGLGSGVINFVGTNSRLFIDIADASTMSNSFVSGSSGAGQLIKSGTGTVTFNGDNTAYTGAVSIQAGRLIATGTAGLTSGSASITIGDGATLEYNSGAATPITINSRITSSGTTGGLIIGDNTSVILTQSNALPTVNVSNGSKLYLASTSASALGGNAAVTVDATSALVNRQANLTIPSLNLSGTFWLSDAATAVSGTYNKVTISKNLSGNSSGAFVFRTSLSAGKGDYLTITSTAANASTYKVYVNNTDTAEGFAPERFNLITSSDANAHFTLANEIATMSGYIYGLQQDGNTHYLFATNSVSHEVDAVLNTASVMSTDWHYELDSVSRRMGDVRQELKALGDKRPGGNVWARGNAYHIDADAQLGGYAFSQDAYGLSIGADKALRIGKSFLLAGAFVGTTTIDRTFDNRGDGSTDSLSGGLYITWLHSTGWYVDATVKMNKYDNDFTARDSDGSILGAGTYDNKATGGSLEIGRLIEGPKGWWLELALQAAYAEIEGARFTTTAGTPVVIFDSEATQYRAAARWGKKFMDNRLSLWMKAALVGTNNDCGDVRIYGSEKLNRADIDGLRMEAGFGVNYALSKRSQLYFDYEYGDADHYTRPWSFNLGYRLLW